MIIAISGTPGTGKTTLAEGLTERLGYHLIDVNAVINEHEELVIENDKERDTKIIDEDSLLEILKEKIETNKKGNKGIIIDSHLSHMLDRGSIDVCIVLSCDLSILKKRLEARGYNELKIEENLEAEAFDEILEEAKENGHDVISLRTDKDVDMRSLLEQIKGTHSSDRSDVP